MMQIREIFEKPIDRPIEGVIKADDQTSLRLEVEEYVVTQEIASHLSRFFDAYNDYQGANGVWISGFFGSGKSHLLKMLALLLENRTVDGVTMLDYFRPKVKDDALLRGAMEKAVSIPSQSILFNIDQKADAVATTNTDALLTVFLKVFNDTCGYYGKQGYIAKFERDLDERGLLEAFRQAYKEIAGIPWEEGREVATLEKANVDRAYARVSGADAPGIIDSYRNDYRVSIEDFAELVNAYIQKQPDGFRLNFFVDEVGQFIADNVKLMTNLQTIAESLATHCRGRAWIIVTAQEDMDTVLGEMNRQQTNDFSKIQDRFKVRLKLTSRNVDQVIEERLLRKRQSARTLLSGIYERERNNFGTLFDFVDGTSFRNYRSEDDFIHKYPFTAYHFPLFQRAIESLSQHSAFEGRHSSVGERSMLGVFQEVVKKIADQPLGHLATFDYMFEGIRAVLKAQIQRAVIHAEEHLGDAFAVRVLKALFLVKYVKGFKATPHNIRILMQETFDQDIQELQKRVESALALLERQVYIQRTGDEYAFLTDEEKDVEREIKNTDVDLRDLVDLLAEMFFNGIVKERKIRYAETGQDFPFTRKADGHITGREHELTIHLVTPFHENAGNLTLLKANALGTTELTVVLPADDRLIRDVRMYKKTEKYLRQNQQNTNRSASIQRILAERSMQNGNRLQEIRGRLAELVSKASLLVAGDEIEISAAEPRTRILQGFEALVKQVYPNLQMLNGKRYDEAQIGAYLQVAQNALFEDPATLGEAEREILSAIQANHRRGQRTTLKTVVEKFERKPYGWSLGAIQCLLARLCAIGKVEVYRDGNLLTEERTLENALRNTRGFENVILEPQAEFSAAQIKALRRFYQNFFDQPPGGTDARALGEETKEAFKALAQELEALLAQQFAYPFLKALQPPLAAINTWTGKHYSAFFSELPQDAETLLDWKEEVIDPIRRFMSGRQREIYDAARDFLQVQKPNFTAVDAPEAEQLQAILDAADCYRGNRMTTAKSLMDALAARIQEAVAAEQEQARQQIEKRQAAVQAMDEFQTLTPEQRAQLEARFDALVQEIQEQTLIPMIRDTLNRFETQVYSDLLTQVTTWAQQAGGGQSAGAIAEPPVEYVPRSSIRVDFPKPYLADEADVDAYLQALRAALLEEIRSGKRVNV